MTPTNVASVYLGGGCVKCCFGSTSFALTTSPSSISGKNSSFSSFLLSVPSMYIFIKPSNLIFEPVALNSTPLFNKRSEEHTSELQSRFDLVCRLLLEKKNTSLK